MKTYPAHQHQDGAGLMFTPTPDDTPENRRILAKDDSCMGHHSWTLAEEGYLRTWLTTIDPDAGTIRAAYGGSSDFSDDGDGRMFLLCMACMVECTVPDGVEIDYI